MRFSAEGEAALAKLGEVKHLVKLGFFHVLEAAGDVAAAASFRARAEAWIERLARGFSNDEERARYVRHARSEGDR